MSTSLRPSWVEIDASAISHNASVLRDMVAPAAFCAVVKADGYGHGAIAVARAALSGGATSLAVALVEEGIALRKAQITAPILLLSEPPIEAIDEAVHNELTPTLYTAAGIAAVREAISRQSRTAPFGVQVKIDTGMHRVGCELDELLPLAKLIVDGPELAFEGLWSHLAVADEPDDPYSATQLRRLCDSIESLRASGISPQIVHLANSAGAIAHPSSRLDLVRCGIALYGYSPIASAASALSGSTQSPGLRPALSLHSRVHSARDLKAGERPSYGRVYELRQTTRVATVPLGYADGVPRRLQAAGGQVLIGGVRREFAGSVTMDQVVIDCGEDDVKAGDEVVFIGTQGDEQILASEWANLLGTISYEVLCGIGPRVPRVVVSGGR